MDHYNGGSSRSAWPSLFSHRDTLWEDVIGRNPRITSRNSDSPSTDRQGDDRSVPIITPTIAIANIFSSVGAKSADSKKYIPFTHHQRRAECFVWDVEDRADDGLPSMASVPLIHPPVTSSAGTPTRFLLSRLPGHRFRGRLSAYLLRSLTPPVFHPRTYRPAASFRAENRLDWWSRCAAPST